MHSGVKREPIETCENVPPPSSTVLHEGPTLTNLDYTTVQSHQNPLMSMNTVGSVSVPTSVPTQPIDMGEREKQKLERKRERNRQAASKCRHRKMERITQLEEHVRDLTNKNMDLKTERSSLKQQLDELQQQVNARPRLREHLQHLSGEQALTMSHANYHG